MVCRGRVEKFQQVVRGEKCVREGWRDGGGREEKYK